MIAGLPYATWLLLVLSVGIGLAVGLRAWSRGRRANDERTGSAGSAGGESGSPPRGNAGSRSHG